ncbi:thermostable hemolysin [Actinokineospora soli]|uniref:Thermostable hemolysin n=1 Tax=Actinokineospora soli TaxID=1048753 RepID=A0ABW2TME2_9PSEU
MSATMPIDSARAATLRFRVGIARPGTMHYMYCADLVRRRYLERYQVVVEPRPDLFVTAWDNTRHSPTFGRTLGVAGLTAATEAPMVSEEYLDTPVEQACAALGWPGTERGSVAEMGPLVSKHPGTGLFLMRNLPRVAAHIGYDFLLSTLPGRLLDLAKAAGWEFHILTNSRPPGTFPDDRGTFSPGARTGVLRCGQSAVLAAAA